MTTTFPDLICAARRCNPASSSFVGAPNLKKKHSHVLLWDAHSIKQRVPSIQHSPFPDLILGDNEKISASPALINKAIEILSGSSYKMTHNYPFKGGHITRYFGNPSQGVHSLQLEMTKINYMDDNELDFNDLISSQLKELLKNVLSQLSKLIQTI